MLGWEDSKSKRVIKWDDLESPSQGSIFGSDVLKLGVYDAVAHFNIGSQAALNVLELLEIDPGTFCLAELHHQDQERVHKAEFKAQEENKKKRKIRRARKKKNEDKFSQNEGVT